MKHSERLNSLCIPQTETQIETQIDTPNIETPLLTDDMELEPVEHVSPGPLLGSLMDSLTSVRGGSPNPISELILRLLDYHQRVLLYVPSAPIR